MRTGTQNLVVLKKHVSDSYFLDLPSTWYVPTLAKYSPSFPVWLNPNQTKTLKTLQETFNHFFKINNKDVIDLGLVSDKRSNIFYHDENDWINEKPNSVYLYTDRFFNSYGKDLGSARNMIMANNCWKGIGRNEVSVRKGPDHVNGYLDLCDALTETYFSNKIKDISPSLYIPILGVFAYKDYPSSFLIRDSHLLRCSQIPADIKSEEIQKIHHYLKEFYKTDDLNNIFEETFNHILKCYKSGLFQTSATRQNITITGGLIDCFSVDYIENDEDFKFVFQLFVHDEKKKDEFLNKAQRSDFKWIKDNQVSTCLTPIRYLRSQFESLKYAYNCLNIRIPTWEEASAQAQKELNFPNSFYVFENDGITHRDDAIKILHRYEPSKLDISKNHNSIIISNGKRLHPVIRKKINNVIKMYGNNIDTEEFRENISKVMKWKMDL